MSELYEIVAEVKGSVGEKPILLGEAGLCRYCGSSDPKSFKNRSHTLPEALGNKWITSADECDACNRLFSRYDDALAKSVAPILTVGGTRGKNNKVRQTGRSGGSAVIRHGATDGKRQLSMEVRDLPLEQCVALDPLTGVIRFRVPVASERFVRLGRASIEKAFLDWSRSRYTQSTTIPFADALRVSAEKEVKDLEVWLPIAYLEIEAPISFGPVKISPLTSKMVNDLEERALASNSEQADQISGLFQRITLPIHTMSVAIGAARNSVSRWRVTRWKAPLKESCVAWLRVPRCWRFSPSCSASGGARQNRRRRMPEPR
ncbi:MAG: hypothetical protein WC803_07705 [Sphingomonas sp.]